MEIFNSVFFGNSVKEWMIATGIVILVLISLVFFKKMIQRRLFRFSKKTTTEWDDLVVTLIKKIKFFSILFFSIWIGSFVIILPETIKHIINRLFIVIFLVQCSIWAISLINFWIDSYKKDQMEKDAASVTTFGALGLVLKIVVWSTLLILILDNLGVNITTLIAGLGVGGIAIALAVQNILGDLFASLSIVLDKPFVIGDFIIVNEYLGSVEHIGLKTTRIRSLSGEQLIFANSDLLKSRIRNYKRMNERRLVFSIGVLYDTPYEKLELIPKFIKEIIETKDQTRFDRAHFKDYGNFSLNFEIVYWMKVPDYNTYMDTQQSINLDIYHKFQSEGIEFAYPTQTLFVKNG
jgi:small-conductance mechanosensitive channel